MAFLIIFGMTIALFVAILLFHALLLFVAWLAISLAECEVVSPPPQLVRAFFFLSVIESVIFLLICSCVQICVG